MSAATVTGGRPVAQVRRGPRWALADAWVMTWRQLNRLRRTPDIIFFSTVQPILFVLLFAYVFGGAMAAQVPGGDYKQFLMPGVFVQTVLFGSVATTGIGLAEDMQKGLVDRFRSLPMTRSALLVGRTVSDVVRNAFTVTIMIVVGVLIGFRFDGGVLAALAGIGLLLLFGFSFSWIAALIGLSVRSVEAAQTGGFVWLFPLTFASSAFVPPQTMPDWLRGFAENQPISVTVDALRALFNGTPVGNNAWQSLAWAAGILAVFMPLAVLQYRRTTSR